MHHAAKSAVTSQKRLSSGVNVSCGQECDPGRVQQLRCVRIERGERVDASDDRDARQRPSCAKRAAIGRWYHIVSMNVGPVRYTCTSRGIQSAARMPTAAIAIPVTIGPPRGAGLALAEARVLGGDFGFSLRPRRVAERRPRSQPPRDQAAENEHRRDGIEAVEPDGAEELRRDDRDRQHADHDGEQCGRTVQRGQEATAQRMCAEAERTQRGQPCEYAENLAKQRHRLHRSVRAAAGQDRGSRPPSRTHYPPMLGHATTNCVHSACSSRVPRIFRSNAAWMLSARVPNASATPGRYIPDTHSSTGTKPAIASCSRNFRRVSKLMWPAFDDRLVVDASSDLYEPRQECGCRCHLECAVSLRRRQDERSIVRQDAAHLA